MTEARHSLQRPARPALAIRVTEGEGPTVVFLPGYASDMAGSKAEALAAWAARRRRRFVRFDYAGCGESAGSFADETLVSWSDDALAVVEAHAGEGPVILVGSSMGGWLMLHVALALGDRVVGLVGIAAAPDFTDWGFDAEQVAMIECDGELREANPYGPEPTLTSRALWLSGAALRLLDGEIAIDAPVRLLHGDADTDVPLEVAFRLARALRSADVVTSVVKGGDHRLSGERDLARLIATVESLS